MLDAFKCINKNAIKKNQISDEINSLNTNNNNNNILTINTILD